MTIREMAGPDELGALYNLRLRVLRPGRPAEDARFAGDDATGTIHLGAFVEDRLVGIASLMPEKGLRLRGMAVEPEMRGRGVGAALVRRVHEIAADTEQDLWCNARVSAAEFYKKMGWITEGEPFDIPGVGPHYVMRWRRFG